jgi:hypothetical protein
VDINRCALTVLINVTKDVTLAENVVHNGDTTEMLVDLMQMFRDKKLIFNLSCELLTRFVFAQSDIKVIKKFPFQLCNVLYDTNRLI